MENFKLPRTPEAINKSIRIPLELEQEVNKRIKGECSFSAFVVEALRFALKNMEKK